VSVAGVQALGGKAAPKLAGDTAPCGAFREEFPPEHPRALESGVDPVRDGRGGGDPDEPPEGGRRRRVLSALRFSEVAKGLGAVSLAEGGPADDELPRPAKGDDFGMLALLPSE